MADNFCTQCGRRLTGALKFCGTCGAPVGGVVNRTNRFLDSDAPKTEDLGVPVSLLNNILACSMRCMPLEDDFLFVEDRRQRRPLIPVVFIESLKDLKILSSAMVIYYFDGIAPTVRSSSLNTVSEEVRNAFVEKDEHLCLEVIMFPCFKARDYGELDEQLRAGWLTVDLDEGRAVVETVVPSTVSCERMKKRLRAHAAMLKRSRDATDDSSMREGFDDLIKDLKGVIKTVPDHGFPDHIRCRAVLRIEGEFRNTVLLEDEPEATPAFRGSIFRAGSRSLLKQMATKADVRLSLPVSAAKIGPLRRGPALHFRR
jgi:hypothetical protein